MTTTHIPQLTARSFLAWIRTTGPAGWVSDKFHLLMLPALWCCMVNAVSADTYGLFTYTNNGSEITITGYPNDADGAVVIPAKIPPDTGKPVTTIGYGAFFSCSLLTSVTIPSSVTRIEDAAFTYCDGLKSVTIPVGVTSIGNGAFSYCSGLTSVAIPVGVTSIGGSAFYFCSGLTRVTIPSSVTSIGDVAFGDCSVLTSVTIPAGVTSIGSSAFQGCSGLTSVTIASSVTHIGDWAFASCSTLTRMYCVDDAPLLGASVFEGVAIGFTVYYFNGKTGFDEPPWDAYPSVSMGDPTPVASWLIMHGCPYNADVLTDPNHDGVNLLMAYALNLDPQENLAGSLPQPVTDRTHLSLTFYAGNANVTYAVESSYDLKGWSAGEVTLSGLDGNNCRTATVDRVGHDACFMRLVVEQH